MYHLAVGSYFTTLHVGPVAAACARSRYAIARSNYGHAVSVASSLAKSQYTSPLNSLVDIKDFVEQCYPSLNVDLVDDAAAEQVDG